MCQEKYIYIREYIVLYISQLDPFGAHAYWSSCWPAHIVDEGIMSVLFLRAPVEFEVKAFVPLC